MTIYVFLIWTAVALAWYFFYGMHALATLGAGAREVRMTMRRRLRARRARRARSCTWPRCSPAPAARTWSSCAVVPGAVAAERRRGSTPSTRRTCRARPRTRSSRARGRLPVRRPGDVRRPPRALGCRRGCSRSPSSTTRALIVVGSSRPGRLGHVSLRQRQRPAAAQLARARRPRAARVPRRRRRARARVTAAFGGTEADDLVVAAAGVAARVGARCGIASFAVRPRAARTRRRRHRGRRAR